MLLTIARWLFQLPGKLFGLIFKNRLRIFLFFMLVAIAVLGAKRYLRAHQYDDEFSLAAPTDYNRAIKREMPLRGHVNSAAGRCTTMPGSRGPPPPVICISRRGCPRPVCIG